MRSSLERQNGPARVGRSLEWSTVENGDDDIEASLCERPRSDRGPRAWRTRTGAPGNLGGVVVFTETRGTDTPLIKSWRCDGCTTQRANHAPTVIPRNEGNEVKRDERRGVGALHSTDEAGEPARGTPWRKGRAGRENRWRER